MSFSAISIYSDAARARQRSSAGKAIAVAPQTPKGTKPGHGRSAPALNSRSTIRGTRTIVESNDTHFNRGDLPGKGRLRGCAGGSQRNRKKEFFLLTRSREWINTTCNTIQLYRPTIHIEVRSFRGACPFVDNGFRTGAPRIRMIQQGGGSPTKSGRGVRYPYLLDRAHWFSPRRRHGRSLGR